MEQRAALVQEARAVQESKAQGGEAQAWQAAGPEPCPTGRQLRPGKRLSTAAAGPGAKTLAAHGRQSAAPSVGPRSPRPPGTAAGPDAKPLTARGQQGRLAAPSARPTKPMPTWNYSWPASAARSPGSHSHLSLHISLQAEGTGSGLGQLRKGLPQCSSGPKGSSSAAKVGAQAEEARRASEGCEDCQHAVTSQHY